MLGLFLQPSAIRLLDDMDLDDEVHGHALEVLEKGYTVIKAAIPPETCSHIIQRFAELERANPTIFHRHQDALGHYPRVVNLHAAFPELKKLFVENTLWLKVQDVLFGAQTALYTSLFYQVGSQQPIHRDTPLFATRPEYLYFGNSVYLEPAGDANGCLEVIEGGHRLPELDREELAIRHYGSLDAIPNLDDDLWRIYQDAVAAQMAAAGLTKKKVYAGTGDSLIWHPQLPHGGARIEDPERTRYSLVMHTTPVGVPVYHQQAFFNPAAKLAEMRDWDYEIVSGRKIVNHQMVDFGHQMTYPVSAFNSIS